MTTRGALLDDAKAIVTGARNTAYGDPEDNFQQTADLLNAKFLYMLKDEWEFSADDVAVIMILLKVARIGGNVEGVAGSERDTWLDIAGYAACGWECVEKAHAVPYTLTGSTLPEVVLYRDVDGDLWEEDEDEHGYVLTFYGYGDGRDFETDGLEASPFNDIEYTYGPLELVA